MSDYFAHRQDAAVTAYAPAPMQPTRYTSTPPPELYQVHRPATLTHDQVAMLLAGQQYPPVVQASPADTRISGRAKDVALVAAAGGTGIGAAATGIGYAAGMVASVSAGLMTAAIALAIAVASIVALTTFVRSSIGSSTAASTTTTHVTQHVTATGLFGRANGTINL